MYYPEKRKKAVILLILMVIALLLIFHIPAAWLYDESNSVCIHKMLFGVGCPFCGMTRAGYELLHLNIIGSLKENFNIIPFVLTLISAGIYYLYPLQITRKFCIIMLLISCVGFILVYILRWCALY